MSLIDNLNKSRIPQHVAIIMDGNGRWAKERHLDRSKGHAEGINTVRAITEIASDIGVKYLTLYTFSTENWNRPKEEVDTLMSLIVYAIQRETADLIKNNVRLTIIGEWTKVPDETRFRLNKCMEDTAHCTGINLILAISYSSRWEIVNAVKSIVNDAINGKLSCDDINEETIDNALSTKNIPDPDLLIRTGGEERISNFLMWQIAYSELYFSNKYWPEFSKEDFCNAVLDYQGRERRFGKTSEQVH